MIEETRCRVSVLFLQLFYKSKTILNKKFIFKKVTANGSIKRPYRQSGPKGAENEERDRKSSLWVNRFNREFTGNTCLDWLQKSQISLFPLQHHHLSSPLRDGPTCSTRTAWVARGDKEARYQQSLVLEWTKRQVTSGASCAEEKVMEALWLAGNLWTHSRVHPGEGEDRSKVRNHSLRN